MEQGPDDGGCHSSRRHNHAPPGSVRMAQALEPHHKKNGGKQVSGLKDDLSGAHFFSSAFGASFLWNILSMRSVIRNPPVTLIMAEVTATHPSTEISIGWGWSA